MDTKQAIERLNELLSEARRIMIDTGIAEGGHVYKYIRGMSLGSTYETEIDLSYDKDIHEIAEIIGKDVSVTTYKDGSTEEWFMVGGMQVSKFQHKEVI